jgi:hypothetical protein
LRNIKINQDEILEAYSEVSKLFETPVLMIIPSPLRGEGQDEGENKTTPHLNPLPQGERKCV